MAGLCEHTGASLSTVEKVFRYELSIPPTAYIRNRRLNAARRLLVSDEHDAESISRIAIDLGFNHWDGSRSPTVSSSACRLAKSASSPTHGWSAQRFLSPRRVESALPGVEDEDFTTTARARRKRRPHRGTSFRRGVPGRRSLESHE